jgi:hypothetical protein
MSIKKLLSAVWRIIREIATYISEPETFSDFREHAEQAEKK